MNVIDLLTLKKMTLGITDMTQMYIDGNSLKLVEDEGEEVNIRVTGYEIDLDSQTIHINGVDGKLQELTLQFTDSTEYNGEFTNLSELANMVISCETYPLQSDPNLEIIYDTATNEVLKCYQLEYSTSEEATSNATDNTQKTLYTGDVNLDGEVNVIDLLSLKKMLLGITDMTQMYIDGDSLKLVEDQNQDEGEEVTIIVTGYEIDLNSQTININGVDGTLQLLTLKFTDSTEYNGEFTNLSELANMVISYETYPLQSDPNLEITYDTATNEVLKCYQIGYSYQQPSIQTIYSMIVSFGDNSLSIAEGDPIQYMVTDDTTITLYDPEETITFEELKEAYQTADGYMELEINYYYNETSQQYEVSSIKAYYVVFDTTTNTITIKYGDGNVIQNIDNTERCIEIDFGDLDGGILLYATDDTTYSGRVSNFDDLEQYQSCYQDIMTTSAECITLEYTWTITYHVTDKNVIDSIDVSISNK